MVDYVSDPLEASVMESWNEIEDLIKNGAQQRFGTGAAEFLRGICAAYLYEKGDNYTLWDGSPLTMFSGDARFIVTSDSNLKVVNLG